MHTTGALPVYDVRSAYPHPCWISALSRRPTGRHFLGTVSGLPGRRYEWQRNRASAPRASQAERLATLKFTEAPVSTVCRITDDTTLAEIEDTLRLLNDAARRVPHVFGVCQPSSWDIAHRRLDAVLDDWLTVRDRDAARA